MTTPTETDRRALLGLLHGELPAAEAERLRARLAADPELAAAHAQLAAVWRAAAPPPAAPPPPGFSGRVMARVRAAAREPRWSEAPPWVRAATAAAAVAGLLAGVGLGTRLPALSSPAEPVAVETAFHVPSTDPAGQLPFTVETGFDDEQVAALGLDGGLAGGYWEALGVIGPGEADEGGLVEGSDDAEAGS